VSRPDTTLATRVLRHGGAYAGFGLVERVLAVAMVPVYAHYLGAAGYGIVAVLGGIAPLLAIAFSQGLLPAWVRLRVDYEVGVERRRFESTLVWYLVVSTPALLAAIALFGDGLAALLAPGIPFYPLVALACASAAAQLFSDLYLRHLQADQNPRAYVLWSALRLIVGLCAVLALVVAFGLGPLGKLSADAAVALVFGAIAIARLRPLPPARSDRALLRRSLAYGFPLIPHMLLAHLNQAASRILVAHGLGLAAAGVFSMGLAIAQFGGAVATTLNQAYQPVFFDAVKRAEQIEATGGSGRELRESAARAGLWIVCTVAGLGLLLSAGARELLAVVATGEFADSWRVVAPVSAATVAIACNHVFSQAVFYAPEGTRRIAWITALTAALHVAGNLLLLPRVGIVGAGLALLVAHTVQALAVAWLGRRLLPMPHALSRWLGVLIATGLGLATLYAIDAASADAPLRVAAKGMAVIASGAAALLATGVPPRRWLGALRGVLRPAA
jgi:O-antigen/teichoic acid export membrane protein